MKNDALDLPLIIYPVLYESDTWGGSVEGGSSDPFKIQYYKGTYCEVTGGYAQGSNPCYLPYSYFSLSPQTILLNGEEVKYFNY
jgi:hypothetical protein